MRDGWAGLLTQAAALAADLPLKDAAPPVEARAAEAGHELVIEGVIGWDVTAAGVREALRSVPASAPLTVRVNSPGGLATDGFAIFNLLAQRQGPVTAKVDGIAASAASYIIMAAARVEMPDAALLMIHRASCMTYGNEADHAASAACLTKIDGIMTRIYAARTGLPDAEVAEMMAAETYMDGAEAVARGFADAAVGEVKATAKTTFDAWATFAGVKLPAGASALAQANTAPPVAAHPPKEPTMADTEQQPGGAVATVSPTPAGAVALAQIARKAGLGLDWIEAQATAGATMDAATSAALDAVAQRSADAAKPSGVQVTRDEGDTKRRAIAAALDVRAGVRVPEAEAAMAGEMRGWTLMDFARASVAQGGGRNVGAPLTIAKAALGLREAMASVGMHTTSDFPALLANTAAKSLREGYSSAPRTFTAFGRQATLPDFKTITRVALAGAPQLNLVNENGEIEFGSIGEAAESYRVFRYGRRVGITFEVIVNDDLGAISRVPGMFGSAASRLESDTVWGIFNANPNMADGIALFAAGHSNTGTGALSVANLGAGRSAMRKQTAPNGDILNLTPRYLIVPAELETAAASFMVQTVVPNSASTTAVNPWAGHLTVIPEPRLASATQWYLATDPAQVDTVEYAYMAGMEAPTVSSYTDEATDGVILKCTHCFGAKAIDWRGFYRSSGV